MNEPTRKARLAEVPVGVVQVTASLGGEARGERVSVGSAEGNALRLQDREVSRFHLEVRSAAGGIDVEDLGSTNGTWIGAVRVRRATVPSGTALRVGSTTLVVNVGDPTAAELAPGAALSGLRGGSVAMRRLMASVSQVATTTVPVLLSGESGTGKELVARALHELGPRSAGPFEIVDCGALVPTLVASELFGHERGAFSGADARHVGAFERAEGGTLFLDEIGELPAAVQPALLGALERRRVRRLGGKQDFPVDVRVVAATHRDLRVEINEGRFRLDLFYRLAVVTLSTPPLRDRTEDIPLLVEHFLRELGRAEPAHHWLSADAMRALASRRFEGNVRELRNLVHALVALGELPDTAPGPEDRSEAAPTAGPAGAAPRTFREARDLAASAFERSFLGELMARTGGNASRAAREASMDRSHLLDLLRKHQLR